MDNSEDVRNAIKEKRCLFGTVDSWLLYVMKNSMDNYSIHLFL
jgi:glycerol kinase